MVPFWSLSALLFGLAYYRHQVDAKVGQPVALGPGAVPNAQKQVSDGGKSGKPAIPQQEPIEKLLKVDMMGLEVGYGLISLVDTKRGGNILERIKSIRRQLALELGIVVPPIRIRDNLQLRPNQYSILIKGISVAQGELMINHLLAMNPGTAVGQIDGVLTREPAFGLEAYWIKENQHDEAQNMGYTVVDLQTVVTTHISEVIKRHAYELLGRQETQALVDNLADSYPKIVEDLIPNVLPVGTIQRVLQNLLAERVSVRDLLTIMEALAEAAPLTKDPAMLTELTRQSLARAVVQPFLNDRGELAVITLNPELERFLTESIQNTDTGSYIVMPPDQAQRFVDRLNSAIENSAFAMQPIVLVNPSLRLPLRRLIEKVMPNLVILGQGEIPNTVSVVTIGVVGDL
jgi:flagellar biosynthesis protein FlhA